ncbi:MAG: DUF1080 domain-containing protein [Eubacteriales bacterium]|nr:DUF1080 domain-containing protein [Eubacteriales bacterium]
MNSHEKIILFDGSGFDNWKGRGGKAVTWDNDGEAMTVVRGDIISEQEYADAFIHVEFKIPDMPRARGQSKGNSGVYVHGCYEIQVLDTYEREKPGDSDCGAIYNMYAPLMNACKPAEQWQSYDIIIRAPVFDAGGGIAEYARLTLLHNGLPIHNNIVLGRTTPGGVSGEITRQGPLLLQDHGDRVSFRNIWMIRL